RFSSSSAPCAAIPPLGYRKVRADARGPAAACHCSRIVAASGPCFPARQGRFQTELTRMFEWVANPAGWAALVTLSAMEIVLGIDNVVFISVLVSKLPREQAERARRIGLLRALVCRVVLLFALTAIMRLTAPACTILGNGVSWRDIILIAGGAFLIAKATHEIHAEMEGPGESERRGAAPGAFTAAVAQITVIDLVFSVDSIVTAIGMAQDVSIMIIAVVIA